MKYFSTLKSHFSIQKGFTLIEVLVAVAIMAILLGVATINFSSVQHKTTLSSTVDILLADLSQQQIKAMAGDTEGRGAVNMYGLSFGSAKYTLFYGTYSSLDSANFDVVLPTSQQVTTTFPGSEIKFATGSGEIVGFDQAASTITLQDTVSGEQKTIQLNRYGVVMGVN